MTPQVRSQSQAARQPGQTRGSCVRCGGEFHPPTEAERGPLLKGWVATLLTAYGEPG